LIKFPEESAVYIVNEKTKSLEPIINEQVFTDRGFDWNQIQSVEKKEYNDYQLNGHIFYPDGTLVKSMDNTTVYKIENNKKRPILTEQIFNRLGYSWNNIKIVAKSILSLLTDGKGIK